MKPNQQSQHSEHPSPFSLGLSAKRSRAISKAFYKTFEIPFEYLSGLKQLNDWHKVVAKDDREIPYSSKIIDCMNVTVSIVEGALERIPKDKPVIVVSNHPFGGIEGIILADLLRKRRTDSKILVNFLLKRVEGLKDNFIFVDPFGTKDAKTKNLSTLKESVDWVKNGGLLSVFPSGTVSHYQLKKREVSDPEWSSHIARIIRRTDATVVPIFFHGQNPLYFHLAGLIHPLLRTALLPKLLCAKSNSEVRLRIGNPITPERLRRIKCDSQLADFLRLRTYILGSTEETKNDLEKKPPFFMRDEQATAEKIIEKVDRHLIESEIRKLPTKQHLLECGNFLVLHAKAQQIPNTLREIGRLREITFRDAGEGSGKSLDVDRFDNYYKHLFVWDRVEKEIVGSYRLGETDVILEKYGVKGLYTHTLFSYNRKLLDQMGPSIELGRSFVQAKYQKNYNSLNLLWKGIGKIVEQDPKYRVLFGTVSISNDYETVSQQLIASFLKANRFLPELARFIRARNPIVMKKVRGIDYEATNVIVRDMREVSELVAEIESNQRSVPVLLKQYLKLGGQILGFNIDRSFGGVLDGLIYVDLKETDNRLLNRYIGRPGADRLLSIHQKTNNLQKTGT